jgi:EmrB/QacA subfamily drug resistance transporter
MEAMPLGADEAVAPNLGVPSLSRRAKMEILFAILLALFLGALDQTIVGTALPQIVTDLGGNDLYTWVVTIYLLTSTITVPFYGKLSDLYGRKPLLIIGISLFLIGSALSGLSQTMEQLILFRGIQGLGAGALFPIALAVIGDLFTPAERGKYQGLFGAVFGISFLIGPALGGFITDNISWHWVFYVNIPIGIVSLIVISRLLPNIRRADASRNLDYLGALLFTVAISLILVGLTNKIDQATFAVREWTDPLVGGLIGVGLVLSVIFLFVESRAKEPIIPLDLWRNRTYSTSIVSTFFVSFGFFGAIIFLPRWFQVVRGESATASGYLTFPLLIGLIGGSIISGQLVARTGRYKALILGSLVLMGAGVFAMSQLITADTELPLLFLTMFVTGIGIGPTLAVFTIVVQNAVPMAKLGVATSNLTFFRQIGGSIGLAIAGTVFATALREQVPTQLTPVFQGMRDSLPTAAQGQFDQLASGFQEGGAQGIDLSSLTGVGQSFGNAITEYAASQAGPAADLVRQLFTPFIAQLDHAFYQAFSLAIGQVFLFGAVMAVGAVAAAVFMKELPLRTSFAPETPAAPAEAGGVAEAPRPETAHGTPPTPRPAAD